jgi:hypothetical protein
MNGHEQTEKARKSIITTMVGAVSDIENEFGKLALEGIDENTLKRSLEVLRNKIFDRGNNEVRKISQS